MNEGPPAGSHLVGERVDALAASALSVVARKMPNAPRNPFPVFIETLQRACLSMAPDAMALAINRLRAAGISNAEIADLYVPAVARQLGDEWCADTMGFAEVTIGSARLQGALRDLGPEWRADQVAAPDAPCILIAVAADIYHTLGGVVLAGQMRRMGLSVRLMLGVQPDDLALTLRRLQVQAVFLSASQGETLESLRKLVDAVRMATGPVLPVVIGGTITQITLEHGLDIQALTGANFVTNDPDEAMALCGIATDLTARTNSGLGG